MGAAALLLKHSHVLRNKACNEFLMGALTGIAEFERTGTQTNYTSLFREKIRHLYNRLERVERAEVMLSSETRSLPLELRLQVFWAEIYKTLEECKGFVGSGSPMSLQWKDMLRNSLFDLIEQIIMVFSPSIEEDDGPCLFE